MGGTRALGQAIAEGRAAHDPPLTQVQLARLVGISQQAISRYERGLRQPPAELLRAIARALGVDPRVLFDFIINGGPD